MNVDGAPTIFCFHASCIAAVSEANRRLRRALGAAPWKLRLPDGHVLRSGDVLQKDGTFLRSPGKDAFHRVPNMRTTWKSFLPGGGLDELAEGEELRQRGRDDAELDGNVDLVES